MLEVVAIGGWVALQCHSIAPPAVRGAYEYSVLGDLPHILDPRHRSQGTQ
jgi:hypothetical protein